MIRERIVKLETNVDHLTGEEIGAAIRALNELDEVLDASYFSGLGKKNRPCGKLEALCHEGAEEAVARAIFRHTHSLGVRILPMERFVLERSEGRAQVAGREARAKNYRVDGSDFQRLEAGELERLAKELGQGMPALRLGKGPAHDGSA